MGEENVESNRRYSTIVAAHERRAKKKDRRNRGGTPLRSPFYRFPFVIYKIFQHTISEGYRK
jgi:hypothetical protein